MPARRKPELNEALTDAVRELGSPATLRELEARGVRRVRSVSLELVSLLIEKAINRTIMERTLGASNGGDLELLAGSAQAGLLSLIRGVEEVEASRGAISRSRTELLTELADMRRDRLGATAKAPLDASDPTLQKMLAAIREAFGKLGPRTPETMAIERALLQQSTVLLEEVRRRTAAAVVRERDDQVDRLERRVRKLVQSLETTERALERVAAMKDVDPGIASVYRAVQGLSAEESNRALKQEIMGMIFKANVELRKQIATTN